MRDSPTDTAAALFASCNASFFDSPATEDAEARQADDAPTIPSPQNPGGAATRDTAPEAEPCP